MELFFKDLEITSVKQHKNKIEKKIILNKLTGILSPGHFTAIIGIFFINL